MAASWFRWAVLFSLVATPALGAPDAPEPPAAVYESPGRQGFFLRFAPKFSYLFLWSNANVASSFRQELPSSADAQGYGFEGQIGREVWGRVSLAAAVDFETYRRVHANVTGETIAMEHFQLGVVAFGLVVTAFPVEDLGWYTGLKASLCSIEPAFDNESFNGNALSGPQMRGACVSALGGYEWRVSRGWWMGLGARFSYLRNTTNEGDQSLNAVSPGLMLTATYY
jgi:hypothetical protein